VNAKRIYRLYDDEGLAVRTKPRKKLASRARVPLPTPTRPNERWSMDFVSARLVDGRWFRTLTVIDIYTREALALVADRSLTGIKVAAALTPLVGRRRAPTAITVDNGGEFVSRAMDAWAYAHDVRLEFIRPGKRWRMRSSKLQWPTARRMPERPCLRIDGRGAAHTRRLAPRLQSRPPA